MLNIAVIGGDGTGPEVIAEATKVLKSLESSSLSFNFNALPFDGTRYLKTGKTLSDSDIDELKKHDAILLGAIGHTDIAPGILEKNILLKMRFSLDQYINLRPVKLYPNVETPLKNIRAEDIDYVVVRENTGGLYTGVGSFENKGSHNEIAIQQMIYTRKQVERCIRFAFEYSQKRHTSTPWKGLSKEEVNNGYTGKVTLCGKTNVLTYVFDLWERVFKEVAKEYPKIIANYVHVDAVCIYMVENPQQFDVIVTSNMFGDIITDLAATTQGGMGVAGSGNINPEGVSMFEPIGGTAPAFTGLNQINPMAAITAAHMMLSHLKFEKEAQQLENSKVSVIKKMNSMAAGKMGFSTSEIGDMVVDAIHQQ